MPNNNKKISIITAVYNRQETIGRSLQSIKDQTYENTEIVLIDGASTDNTKEIAKKYITEKDMFLSEPDSGIYDALNKGLKFSSGDVIGFLHSDDFYSDSKVISKVMDIFLNEDVDVVYGDICFFKSNNPQKVVRKYNSCNLSRKNLAWGKMPAHPAIFIRKKIYDSIGAFNLNYKIAADYEFLCRLVKYRNLKAKYLSIEMIKMQLGGASTAGIKNTILINQEVLKALKNNGIYSNIFMVLSKYPYKILEFLK